MLTLTKDTAVIDAQTACEELEWIETWEKELKKRVLQAIHAKGSADNRHLVWGVVGQQGGFLGKYRLDAVYTYSQAGEDKDTMTVQLHDWGNVSVDRLSAQQLVDLLLLWETGGLQIELARLPNQSDYADPR